jgi:hypothetical protein
MNTLCEGNWGFVVLNGLVCDVELPLCWLEICIGGCATNCCKIWRSTALATDFPEQDLFSFAETSHALWVCRIIIPYTICDFQSGFTCGTHFIPILRRTVSNDVRDSIAGIPKQAACCMERRHLTKKLVFKFKIILSSHNVFVGLRDTLKLITCRDTLKLITCMAM